MPLQFNPYPLEPYLNKIKSEQDNAAMVPNSIAGGLTNAFNAFMQAKEQQKQNQLRQMQMRRLGQEIDYADQENKPLPASLFGQSQVSEPQPNMSFARPMLQQNPLSVNQGWSSPFNQWKQAAQMQPRGNDDLLSKLSGLTGVQQKRALEILNKVGEYEKNTREKPDATLTPYQEAMLLIANKRFGLDNEKLNIQKNSTEQKDENAKTKLDTTYELYQTARDGLLNGLRGTNTGYFSGRLPTYTSNQQIAEGSVAAMAPVLKQLFRVAGEGVFTDRDQALLLDMIPTRRTNPEAREAQIQNIDNIVNAKLGRGRVSQQGSEVMVNSMEEINKLPKGTRFNFNGRKGTVQ